MSNETKWTKGPWEVVSKDYGMVVRTESPSKTKYGASRYAAIGGFDRSDEKQLREAKANAHLIAAAPDGAALAELVMDFCGNPKGLSEAQQDELYETALQFMKKARGETS